MPRPLAHEQGDTLGRIRAAAFSLFGRYGHDGVSMLALAKASGVTKAALYWHLANKEALYAECMRRLVGVLTHVLFQAHARGSEIGERAACLFTPYAEPANATVAINN